MSGRLRIALRASLAVVPQPHCWLCLCARAFYSWHRMRLKKEYEEDPEGLKQRWWRGGGKRVTGGPGRLHADGTFTGACVCC